MNLGTLHLINPAPTARADIVRARLPMAEGFVKVSTQTRDGEFEFAGGERIPVVDALGRTSAGEACLAIPAGGRRLDGSQRALEIIAPVVLPPGRTDLQVSLENDPVGAYPFAFSDWVLRALAELRFDLVVDGRLVPFIWGFSHPSGRHFQRPHLSQFFALRCRDDATGFWADLLLEVLHRRDHAKFSLMFGWSDDRDPSINLERGPQIGLRVGGCVPVFHFGGQKGHVQSAGTESATVLLEHGGRWGDTQAQETRGVLAFLPRGDDPPDAQLRRDTLAAEQRFPVLAVGRDWGARSAFGPFGIVPATPGLEDPGVRVMAGEALGSRELGRLPHGSPWGHGRHACDPSPSDREDQPDFGVGQLYEVVESETPDLLHAVRFSVGQEACRPCSPRELDAARVTHAEHPEWYTWARYTHPDPSVPDRLGKPAGQVRRTREDPRSNRPWFGHDRAHDSVLHMAAYFLLTGEPRVFDLLEDWTQQYLAEHPVLGSGGVGAALENIGTPQGLGWASLSAAWTFCALGDEELRERVRMRWRQNVTAQWHSRANLGPVPGTELSVFAVSPPSASALGVPSWSPLQEAVACLGGAAVYRITGEDTILPILRLVLRTLAMNAVRKRPDGDYDLAARLAWLGDPLPDSAWSDPTRVVIDNALRKWLVPSFTLGLELAQAQGDDGWRARCVDVLDRWTGDRAGGWDDLTPWLGATFGGMLVSP